MTAFVFANLKSGSNLQLFQHLILMKKDERNLLKVLAELGDVERVNKLIDFGADVNASSTLDGSTALIGAARGNCAEVVTILLNNGANVKHVDMFGLTALDWAEACGCEETAALLRLASGCPLWSPSMVTELLKGTTSSSDNSKSDTVERGGTWLGPLLTQHGVSSDHIAWCEDVLIQQEGFCTIEVFASFPESVMSRAYLSSVGICQLGVQQVLLQVHAELQRGLDEKASWNSYTVSESTNEVDSSGTTSCLEEEQSSSDDSAENRTSASSDSSTSSRSSSSTESDSESDISSGSCSISSSNNDDSTNSDSSDPSSPTSFYKTYCASAQYSDTSDNSNNTDNGGSTGLADRCTKRASVKDCDSTNSVTRNHATTIPKATTVSSTSTASTTPSTTNNTATGFGTFNPVTSARCTCLCFFCPAGRQVALRIVHTTLAKYHVVILLCLASASVGLVAGYSCTAQGMLMIILLMWFLLMVMAAVAVDACDEETE